VPLWRVVPAGTARNRAGTAWRGKGCCVVPRKRVAAVVGRDSWQCSQQAGTAWRGSWCCFVPRKGGAAARANAPEEKKGTRAQVDVKALGSLRARPTPCPELPVLAQLRREDLVEMAVLCVREECTSPGPRSGLGESVTAANPRRSRLVTPSYIKD